MQEKNINREIINQNLVSAIKGKKVYKNILKNFHKKEMRKIDDWGSAVLLFPSHDDEINYYGLAYLDQFLFRTNVKRVAIITSDEKVRQVAKKMYPKNEDIYIINDSAMSDILLYYRLYPFDNRIKIISLDEPLGRKANNLLGAKGITKEMLIAIGIYCLIPFEKITITSTKKNKSMSIFNKGSIYEHR